MTSGYFQVAREAVNDLTAKSDPASQKTKLNDLASYDEGVVSLFIYRNPRRIAAREEAR